MRREILKVTKQTIRDYCYDDDNNFDEIEVNIKQDQDNIGAIVEIGDHSFESQDLIDLANLVKFLTKE